MVGLLIQTRSPHPQQALRPGYSPIPPKPIPSHLPLQRMQWDTQAPLTSQVASTSSSPNSKPATQWTGPGQALPEGAC